MRDWRDQTITGASEATRTALDDFAEGLLGFEPRAANILAAADEDPDCALAQASAAMLYMFLETRDADAAARPYILRARSGVGSVTERERATIEATQAWVEGDIARAVAIGEQAANDHPRDMVLAKITQYHHFNLGDAAGMLRVALPVLDANRDAAPAYAQAAFAWEQCNHLDEAERAAGSALDIDAAQPWAQHALAHVMLTQGRNDEARAFLEGAKRGWAQLNSFMHTHNWWHLALVQIEQGEAETVLSYYDQHIWGVAKTYSQDQIGAVSLLARLELVGADVGERWDDLAPFLTARVDDHVLPFLSMQYLYGLARAGRKIEAADMMAAIRRTATTATAMTLPAWQSVCVPACEGLMAYAYGDWRQAVERLGAALPRLQEIGGSHAQRDLFEQIFDDALTRAGETGAARARLEQRLVGNPESVPTLRRLATLGARQA
jgi:Flp pilus assembly protein TadD